MLTALLMWLTGLLEPPAGELKAFVTRPDSSYAWKRASIGGYKALDLTSQTWQGSKWRHDVVLVEPRGGVSVKGGAIVEVTGWAPNKADYAYAQLLADSSGMTVALLFQIPNQPVWGHEEDDLIAYTFEKYFETGDPAWPLLFPMVKSVKAAMDAIQDSTKGSDNPLAKFVVTGGSKRGWASWLVGSLDDPRVVAVAPAVFDNLDFPAQLARQQKYWGEFSPMIKDYTDRGLQDLLGSERGKQLIKLVDPVHSLPRVPVLVLTGTNDAYWTVDSAQVYWQRLTMPKWSVAIPNAPHTMGDRKWWAPSLGLFARASVEGSRLPDVSSSFDLEAETWGLRVDCTPGPSLYRVWKATSSDLHFDQTVWSVAEEKKVPASEGKRGIWVNGERGKSTNVAVLVEMEFETKNGKLRLTTPVYLAPKRG
jgi:PhoPQ-activated pathogenicity-related protein